MKKILCSLIVIVMFISSLSVSASADYSDINGHWGQTYIQAMANKGSIKGYEDGTFKPDKTISRSEFLAIAIRSCYPDYTPAQAGDTWWAGEYNKAIEKGIISETEMPRSEMDVPIRREEMTMIMVRCAEGKGEYLNDYAIPVVNTLNDYHKTGEYYRSYLIKAYNSGLIAGKPGYMFDAQGSATRAEAATVLYRIENKGARVKPDYRTNHGGGTTQTQGAITIQEGKFRQNRNAREGDIFKKANGETVVLKKDQYGILGGGQGVAPDVGLNLGIRTVGENGIAVFTYDSKSHGLMLDSTGKSIQNDGYYINETTGEGHWGKELVELEKQIPAPDRDGSYVGEVSPDSYKLWVWDGGSWISNTVTP